MSVTIYVTEANFICYKGQKNRLFCAKNIVFHQESKDNKITKC